MKSNVLTGWAKFLGWIVVPGVLLVTWQVCATKADQAWMYPTVTDVLDLLCHPTKDIFATGSLVLNTKISLLRVLIGFVFAAVIGIPLGILFGAIGWLRLLFEPLIEIVRPLCPIAWLPFAIVLFKLKTLPNLFGAGYTYTVLDQVQLGMVFVIFVGGLFPILTNTMDGVTGVRRQYIQLAQTLGASRAQIFGQVYLHAAMPSILTGLRQGLGLCWFVIIAAEMMTGSSNGIGFLLMYAADNAAMDVVVACMVIIGSIGAVLNYGLQYLIARCVVWHGKEL